MLAKATTVKRCKVVVICLTVAITHTIVFWRNSLFPAILTIQSRLSWSSSTSFFSCQQSLNDPSLASTTTPVSPTSEQCSGPHTNTSIIQQSASRNDIRTSAPHPRSEDDGRSPNLAQAKNASNISDKAHLFMINNNTSRSPPATGGAATTVNTTKTIITENRTAANATANTNKTSTTENKTASIPFTNRAEKNTTTITATTNAVPPPIASGYFYCGRDHLNISTVLLDGNENLTRIPVDYQCRGELYENFTHRLWQYVRRIEHSVAPDKRSWGQRMYPFPENASILAMGNSHTKQTIVSLLCQYYSQIRSVQWLGPTNFLHPMVGMLFEVVFTNHASLVLMGNHPFVYSHQWAELLQRYDPRHRTLNQFDAILLGPFNPYQSRIGWESIFQSNILDYQRKYPDLPLDFENISAPTLEDVAYMYDGPIVVLPMFARFEEQWGHAARRFAQNATALRRSTSSNPAQFLDHTTDATNHSTFNETDVDHDSKRSSIRHNNSDTTESTKNSAGVVVVLDSRKHIDAMGMECGGDARITVGLCSRNPGMHRCTGPYGGDVDPVVWDFIETMNDLVHRNTSLVISSES